MISPDDRRLALDFIKEAVEAGARQDRACEILEITERTLRRWKKQREDQRQIAARQQANRGGKGPDCDAVPSVGIQEFTTVSDHPYPRRPGPLSGVRIQFLSGVA